MGPPLFTRPDSHPRPPPQKDTHDNPHNEDESENFVEVRKSFLVNFVDNFRLVYLNFTVALLLLQLLFSLSGAVAGPVILSPEHMRGAVTLARNIRHLPCISRRSGEEGVCMFAIDCLKSNGSHLGTCIDRFYFGSCCQIPDKTILPQIIGNNIEDNSIDSSNFVHPQENKIPEVFPKPVTETVPTTVKDKLETVGLKTETVLDVEPKETTLDNKIEDVKLTTALSPDVEKEKWTTKLQESTTELPIKLSTFQTVSSDNQITSKPVSKEPEIFDAINTTTISGETVTKPKPQTTRRPTRPTYKPRPTYRPTNITRPQYATPRPTNATVRPKPSKPVTVFNTTRKPIYRPPPKRPSSTKKPLPIPPRLNITILPQITSTRPAFTRPSYTTITYINTTISTTTEEKPVTLTSTTPGPTTTTTTTTTSTTTLAPSTVKQTTTSTTTELPTEAPLATETIITITEKTEPTTQGKPETVTEIYQETTIPVVTEKATVKPSTEVEIPLTEGISSEFPPGLVTWSSNTETISTPKAPENNVTESDEVWSPITPPEGWILINNPTVPPKPETSSATTPAQSTEQSSSSTEQSSSSTEQSSLSTEQETSPDAPTTHSSTSTKQTVAYEEPIISISTTTDATIAVITSSSTTEEPTTVSLSSETPTKIDEPLEETTMLQPTTQLSTSTVQQTTSSAPETTVTESKTTISPLTIATTESKIPEFTINITLTPTSTLPTTTFDLSSLTSLTENVTESASPTNGTTLANESTTLVSTTPAGNTTIAGLNGTTESSSEGVQSSTESAENGTSTVSTTTENPYNMSDYKDVCGRRLWPEARIVGGAKSGFGRWPWQISLRQWRSSTYLHKCGAALLNENWAITAAHCVEHVPPSELLVRLGEHDLASEAEPYGFAERRVQIVASHPHFDPATFEYDLALLRFYEPVTFQPNILPVCVPDNDDNYVGKTAHVTGWGRLYDEGPLPSVLQEVEVPIINNTACEAMYQAAGYNEHIPNIFICAGKRRGGADSCEGDSGGPMVVQRSRDHRFVLGGVISWGIGCAEPNQPGVYTRISEFRDWINQILQF